MSIPRSVGSVLVRAFGALLLIVVATLVGPVSAASTGLSRFATLPAPGPGHPASIAADSSGNVYVGTFELTEFFGSSMPNDEIFLRTFADDAEHVRFAAAANFIYTFDANGNLKASTPMPAQVIPIGMVVADGKLYVVDVIGGNVLRYSLPLTNASVPDQTYDLCGGFAVLLLGAPGTFCLLNEIELGPDGRLYVTDTAASDFGQFTGRVWVVTPGTNGNTGSIFFVSSELNPNGFPPFGASGLAFTPDKSALLISNVSTDKILKLIVQTTNPALPPSPTNPLVAGSLSTFAQSAALDGPEDLVFDTTGQLWVVLGQTHHVVRVDASGNVVETVGSFAGFTPDGAPRELCQPSAIVPTNGALFVTNECNVTLVPAGAIDFTQLKLFTVSRIGLEIPAGQQANQPNNVGDDKKNDDDDKKKETEEQRRQRARTNKGNKDDYFLEGHVAGVCESDVSPPCVFVANRDGQVKVVLFGDAAKAAGSIQIGDYLEADGAKQHELLFEAESITITRDGRKVR